MNVDDFFYLAHYDDHFVDNLLTNLINQNHLRSHELIDGIHHFNLCFEFDEKFVQKNFNTDDIGSLSLSQISKNCVKQSFSLESISEILEDVRIKSSYYPIIAEAKIVLNYENSIKSVKIIYYVKLLLVPDNVDL